jgi:hypothetical protein
MANGFKPDLGNDMCSPNNKPERCPAVNPTCTENPGPGAIRMISEILNGKRFVSCRLGTERGVPYKIDCTGRFNKTVDK